MSLMATVMHYRSYSVPSICFKNVSKCSVSCSTKIYIQFIELTLNDLPIILNGLHMTDAQFGTYFASVLEFHGLIVAI